MLASISPLGERARGNRWGLTVAGFTVGALVAGTSVGLALGGAGSVTGQGTHGRWFTLSVACIAAAVLDVGRRVPTVHRQVDERWLTRYRGWVYGVGFGGQLGVGVVTTVTTATVYSWLVAAFLTGSLVGGAAVGAAFGLARSVPLAVVARDHTPARVRSTVGRVASWAGLARATAAAASVGIGAVGLVGWARG